MDTDILEWHVPEYMFTEKSSDWFWAVGIITVSAAVTSIIFNNVLFALVILLGSFALTVHAVRRPPLLHIVLNHRGIKINDLFYPYETIDSFWIEDNFHPIKVLVKSKKIFMPFIILPIPDDADPEDIRSYLEEYLAQEEHHEPFLQKLMEHFGF